MQLKYKQMNLKSNLLYREVSERKQVGDAESMINEEESVPGRGSFFGGESEV